MTMQVSSAEQIHRLEARIEALERELMRHRQREDHPYVPHGARHAAGDRAPFAQIPFYAGVPPNFPDRAALIDTSDSNRLKIRVSGATRYAPTATSVQTYAASNVTTDRTYDADSVAIAELADIVGTLIADLRTWGIVA